MAKAVAKKKENELAKINTLLKEDAGSGAESMTNEDFMIPRISLLQDLSPQVKKREKTYVDGAEAGSIFNNVTQKVTDGETGITVLPIKYRRTHLEWKPNRGGFVKDHGSDSSVLDSCVQDADSFTFVNDEGNEIVTTAEYFLFLIEDGKYEPAVLSMSKSQLRKSRRWNSVMNQLKIQSDDGVNFFSPALFYTAYNLTSAPQTNEKGTWFGWEIEMLWGDKGGILSNMDNGEEIYLAARSFKEKVQSGDVKVQPDQEGEDAY